MRVGSPVSRLVINGGLRGRAHCRRSVRSPWCVGGPFISNRTGCSVLPPLDIGGSHTSSSADEWSISKLPEAWRYLLQNNIPRMGFA